MRSYMQEPKRGEDELLPLHIAIEVSGRVGDCTVREVSYVVDQQLSVYTIG